MTDLDEQLRAEKNLQDQWEENLQDQWEERQQRERQQREAAVIRQREVAPAMVMAEGIAFRDSGKEQPQGMTNDRPLPSQPASERLLAEAIKGEYLYARLALFLGFAAIVGGVILGLNGVAGSTSWTAKVLGLESQLNDAAPGVVLFIVGVFFVFLTRPKVKLKDLNG